MKKNFNNEKYYKLQQENILNEINNDLDRTYIEIGGKFINDFHASRVLANYDQNIKFKIINDLNIKFEVIVCISAISIMKNKKQHDSKNKYTEEYLDLVKFLNDNKIKCYIAITRYQDNSRVNSFITKLKKLNYTPYIFYEDENYPLNVSEVLTNGLIKNDYIPCKEKLVYVIGPGPNSGKFAVCISQIFHERNKKVLSTYRKFETFLIPGLSINNPINLACSMAMCDIRGDDCIDTLYLKKYGEMRCVDERDVQSYEILKNVIPESEKKQKSSITEFFINNTIDGITDLKTAEAHAKKEIIRRYKEYKKQFNTNKISQNEFDEAFRIYSLIQKEEYLSDHEADLLLQNFINYWGYDCQSNICIEEMGELIKAICKYKREEYDEKYKANVLEEIADVHNMIIELESYFGKEEISKIRYEKIMRTKEVLKEEMEEDQL